MWFLLGITLVGASVDLHVTTLTLNPNHIIALTCKSRLVPSKLKYSTVNDFESSGTLNLN